MSHLLTLPRESYEPHVFSLFGATGAGVRPGDGPRVPVMPVAYETADLEDRVDHGCWKMTIQTDGRFSVESVTVLASSNAISLLDNAAGIIVALADTDPILDNPRLHERRRMLPIVPKRTIN
jgi:hypothetical protein